MEYITIPEFQVLSGEKAIETLDSFIGELAERRDEELTGDQIATLINIAKALRSSIQP